jgi:hypothetical protein
VNGAALEVRTAQRDGRGEPVGGTCQSAGMVLRRVSTAERRTRLAVRHRHVAARRTDDVVAITDDLVGLHASDPVTVHLSAAARMRTPALGPLGTALHEDRTLVRHHAMRRTLWVLAPAAARCAHGAATVDLLRVQHRDLLRGLAGVVDDPEGWAAAAGDEIVALLAAEGPLSAREVGLRLPHLTVPMAVGTGRGATTMPAHTRLLLVLGFRARVLRAAPTGTWINGQYRWAAAHTWLPGGLGAPPDRRTAAAELARRWLRSFGPGTAVDLRWWAGWTVATTRAALADAGAVEVELESGGTGLLLPDDLDAPEPAPPSALLLPGLDPSTMGWKQRAFHLDPAHVPALFDRNGNGGPTVWADGRIVGGWVQRRDGAIAVRLLADVGAEHRAAVERAAAELEALLGDVRFSVRFPAPLQAELLAGAAGR